MRMLMSATASADGGIIITNDLTTQMTCEVGKYYTLSVSASYTTVNADSPAITYQWYSQSGTVAQTSSPSIQFQAKSNDAIWCVASGSVNGVPVTASSSVCNVYVVSATPTPAPTPIPTVIPVPTATPAAAAPLSRRAVLGVFAGLVALALALGALSLKVRSGAHSAHRRR